MHSVSLVVVDHILTTESSDPVTSMEPSSESAMQLMASSWSPRVSFSTPARLLDELPAPIVDLSFCLGESETVDHRA